MVIMKYMLFVVIAVAIVLITGSGCTTITHINYYGMHPDSVVHDTVYVYEGYEVPDTELGDPGTEPQEEDPTGRVVTILQLDPGTVTVEYVIDYDQGISVYRMLDNVLDGSGLRFEMNTMSEYMEYLAVGQYYLIVRFDSSRNWNEVSPGPLPISDPSITLSIDGEETRFYSTGFSVESAEPLAIGSYRITLLIPVELDLLRRLAQGTRGHLLLRDRDTRQYREITEANFVNFSSFMESFVF